MKSLLSIVFIFSVFFASASNSVGSDKGSAKSETATTITINGKIIDSMSQESLTGVKVRIGDTEYTAYTDFDGNFEISIPSNLKNEEIKISYISYEEVIVNLSNTEKLIIEINPIG